MVKTTWRLEVSTAWHSRHEGATATAHAPYQLRTLDQVREQLNGELGKLGLGETLLELLQQTIQRMVNE